MFIHLYVYGCMSVYVPCGNVRVCMCVYELTIRVIEQRASTLTTSDTPLIL